ncbi:MAG TPA: 4-hydroxybutyrate CoA-transferase, partial [Acidimicrobiia bacterium]|nr:4-hydroxybutyrate CoA-transferase [Acidimicrobiia bacterium]
MTARELSVEEAAALVRPRDSLGVPLGPGIPGDFLHALSARDDWEQLEVFGALLLDLYPLFTKPGVHYLSGFYGPA